MLIIQIWFFANSLNFAPETGDQVNGDQRSKCTFYNFFRVRFQSEIQDSIMRIFTCTFVHKQIGNKSASLSIPRLAVNEISFERAYKMYFYLLFWKSCRKEIKVLREIILENAKDVHAHDRSELTWKLKVKSFDWKIRSLSAILNFIQWLIETNRI